MKQNSARRIVAESDYSEAGSRARSEDRLRNTFGRFGGQVVNVAEVAEAYRDEPLSIRITRHPVVQDLFETASRAITPVWLRMPTDRLPKNDGQHGRIVIEATPTTPDGATFVLEQPKFG